VAIPDYQTLMLPVLRMSAKGEIRVSDVVEAISTEFALTDEERSALLPSGKQTIISNRVHWAKNYLKQAGLVVATKWGHFEVSSEGRKVLERPPKKIDVDFLNQYPAFLEFRQKSNEEALAESGGETVASKTAENETPDAQIQQLSGEISRALGHDILDRIMAASPAFFEKVVVRLLTEMGYGGGSAQAGRAIGKSGDDGVDGVIDQDTLGLDRVYIQAKRYNSDSAIGPSAVRDFFGSLDMHKAGKGLFVTTSKFSKSAIETAEKLGKRIVLIDGPQLASLLVRYNVGCRVQDTVLIKKIDEDFFE
jgi:restriction system protein